MIKTISFDLDGTLVKSTFANLVWLEGLPNIYAEEKKIKNKEAKKYLKKEYDKISDNKPEWYDLKYWFNRFNLKHDWRKLLDKYRHAVEVYPETKNVIRRLHEKFDLIIISNARREFIEIELEETKLRKYFTHVFSSTSDFHRVKKIVEFYQMICDKLNIDPDEIIHVGDHKEFDYHVPRKIGITSFYINRTEKRHSEFIISNLDELEKRINKMYV